MIFVSVVIAAGQGSGLGVEIACSWGGERLLASLFVGIISDR
jgi:hypothetical protein